MAGGNSGILSKVCTECGKEFLILRPAFWTYKTSVRSLAGKSKFGYQCSYTCYDHARLACELRCNRINIAKAEDYVEKCESVMLSQGKRILNPIEVKKVSKFKNKYKGLKYLD